MDNDLIPSTSSRLTLDNAIVTANGHQLATNGGLVTVSNSSVQDGVLSVSNDATSFNLSATIP
ncbi:MAG: hypothetical protein R3C28_13125 [Pirellulaceae bacterium]